MSQLFELIEVLTYTTKIMEENIRVIDGNHYNNTNLEGRYTTDTSFFKRVCKHKDYYVSIKNKDIYQ